MIKYMLAFVISISGLASAQEWQYAMLLVDDSTARTFFYWEGPTPAESARRMNSMEALAVEVFGARPTSESLVGLLNVAGREGWQLIYVNRNSYLFMRPRDWQAQ